MSVSKYAGGKTGDLFAKAAQTNLEGKPLAERIRPRTLDEIVGHRELQHIRRQLQINQDIVEINVLRLVSIHEPGLDLQQAAHRAFQRLLDTDPLLRVDHLHGDSCVRLRARECRVSCAKSYLVVALV